jgi:hypothetical protein
MQLGDINTVLDNLGVVSYGLNLAGGKIHWTNKAGLVVAHAEVKAVLSWAATNNSAMWAHAIGQFEDAGVPVLIPENPKADYIGNINDEQAKDFAAKVAEAANASFLYRAANGANGLYLAVFDFKEESIELTDEDWVRKKRSAMNYSVQMLYNLCEILKNKKRWEEALRLMDHYHKALEDQIEHVTRGDQTLIELMRKQQKSIKVWQGMLPKKRKDVIAFMNQAASKWARLIKL